MEDEFDHGRAECSYGGFLWVDLKIEFMETAGAINSCHHFFFFYRGLYQCQAEINMTMSCSL